MTRTVGLIGCGTVVHENYSATLRGREGYRVRYVHDRDEQQARSAAELFDAEQVSIEGLVSRCDAVVISTPPASHEDLVRRAMRPGIVILCEKPFVTSGRAAAALCAEAEAHGVHLYVGHFRRLFPQVQLARTLVGLGLIGEVTGFAAQEGGRFTWRAVSNYTAGEITGGVLWDTGSHTLDMALFVSGLDLAELGEVRVSRIRRDKPEPSHEFSATWTAELDGRPVHGTLQLSRRVVLPNRIEVTGALGSLSFVTDMDDRVRVTSALGSTVVKARHSHAHLLECFDLQFRRVLLQDDPEDFAAGSFVTQIRLLELLSSV